MATSTACKVITRLLVGIPAAIDPNFRQFITSGKLFFAKLSFGFSKESGFNRSGLKSAPLAAKIFHIFVDVEKHIHPQIT
ncbi:MAG: hypothetical protein ABI462_10415 [Ignavibacteria bacterium]